MQKNEILWLCEETEVSICRLQVFWNQEMEYNQSC